MVENRTLNGKSGTFIMKSKHQNCMRFCFKIGLHTYIIGHYNPSVRIIDLDSHTTYVVCVNFYT